MYTNQRKLNVYFVTAVEEIETDVGRFLKEPTQQNLQKLGPRAAEVIDAHLQVGMQRVAGI